jgi:hypothetical protein
LRRLEYDVLGRLEFCFVRDYWRSIPPAWERRVCEVLERTMPEIRSVKLTSKKEWRKSDIDGSWDSPHLKKYKAAFVASERWPDPAG